MMSLAAINPPEGIMTVNRKAIALAPGLRGESLHAKIA